MKSVDRIIRIGKLVDGKSATLPLKIATDTSAIVGRRGSGKSHFARVLAEEVLDAGVQFVAIDPLDGWWGVRSSRDGKHRGYEIAVFGGEHADLPLPDMAGVAMAEAIVGERISAILSLRHMSRGGQKRFVADFCERLFLLKGKIKNRTPIHVAIDEADMFCPQQVMGEDARCAGAVDSLVRRGRSSGIGVSVITQRPAAISKNVLTQAHVLVAFQLTGPHDKKAVQAWIQDNADSDSEQEVMSTLAGLPRGTAWVWSPSTVGLVRVAVRDTRTFDSSFTPEIGQERKEPRTLANVDVPALERMLTATVEKARESDPAALRKRIKELEGQVSGMHAEVEAADFTLAGRGGEKALRRRISDLERGTARAVEAGVEAYRAEATVALVSTLAEIMNPIREHVQALSASFARGNGPKFPGILSKEGVRKWLRDRAGIHEDTADSGVAEIAERSSRLVHTEPGATMPEARGGKARMLAWLVRHYPCAVSKRKLAMLSGMSPSSGSYATYLASLRSSGLADSPSPGELRATEAGVKEAGAVPPMPEGAEVVAMWRDFLGGSGKRKIFDALVENPGGLQKAALGEAAGMSSTSGSFATYLASLRTLGLVAKGEPVRLSPEMLEELAR